VGDPNQCIFYQEGSTLQQCIQGDNINAIRETLERVNSTLEKVAAQDARLGNHDDAFKENRHEHDIMFGSLREIERTLGKNGDGIRIKVLDALGPLNTTLDKLQRLLDVVTNKWFLTVIITLGGMVLVGALCDAVYHMDLVRKLWELVPHK
jgi:hypothetical protein